MSEITDLCDLIDELDQNATPGPWIAAKYGKKTMGIAAPGHGAAFMYSPPTGYPWNDTLDDANVTLITLYRTLAVKASKFLRELSENE